MKNHIGMIMLAAYLVGDVATFVKLTFFDDYAYTWWNWIFAVPINIFLSTIWPIYWAILVPIFKL